jgi:uroporphyrin-III C-methyltransferase
MHGKKSKLSIVGAGLGDPELITLKAIKAIQNADVILYDSLIHPDLLSYAKANANLIYAGKRRGHKAMQQDEINTEIVRYAMLDKHVVRLKGGDPFVFGRGREEMQFAENQGIACEYIPGVSSAIGAAGAIGIPVTFRGLSQSFWTITATTDKDTLSPDIKDAANSNATAVILMGLGRLSEIVAVYQNAGKDKLPIAVISNATLPNEKAVIGEIRDILEKVLEQEIVSPAVIIIGEVVRLNLVEKAVNLKKEIF